MISELKHQIKQSKLELLSTFLKEKITRKQELERELKEINSELLEFTERYGAFYEKVLQADLDAFLNKEVKEEVKPQVKGEVKEEVKPQVKGEVKEEVKPQVKRRKPMSKETKAKISKAMKVKSKVKSKPFSEVKACDLDEDVKDLEEFRGSMEKLPIVKKHYEDEDKDEDDDRRFDLGKGGIEESLKGIDDALKSKDEDGKEFFEDFLKNHIFKGQKMEGMPNHTQI
jgi:hypothetical protein